MPRSQFRKHIAVPRAGENHCRRNTDKIQGSLNCFGLDLVEVIYLCDRNITCVSTLQILMMSFREDLPRALACSNS